MTLSRPLISNVRRRLAFGHATRRSASRRRARVRPSTSTRRPAESMKRTPVRSMTIEDDPSSTTRLSWSRKVGTAAMSISPCAANTVWSPSFAIWKLASMAGTLAALLVQAQGGDERFLGDLHPADVLHPALALFLALEEFALAADVAAIALGEDVLALGLHRLPGDDAAADGRLDGHVEQLAGNQLAQAGRHLAPVFGRLTAMDDRAEGVDGDAVEAHVDLHQVGLGVAGRLVGARCVAARAALAVIEEVDYDLGHRDAVDE